MKSKKEMIIWCFFLWKGYHGSASCDTYNCDYSVDICNME